MAETMSPLGKGKVAEKPHTVSDMRLREPRLT